MRELRTIGRTFDAELLIYNQCKYKAHPDKIEWKKVEVKGIKEWAIVSGEDAEEIERHTDASSVDDFHEYLVLYFENGEEGTFRNSYVDMFRI